jgi:hypothetical protein
LNNMDERANHFSISFLHRKREKEREIIWLTKIGIESFIHFFSTGKESERKIDNLINKDRRPNHFFIFFYKEREKETIWLIKIKDRIILPFTKIERDNKTIWLIEINKS